MNKVISLSFVSFLAVIILSAACSQTSNNGNLPMNHEGMNHNSMNHNSMPMNSNNRMNSNEMSRMSEVKSDPDAATAPFDLQFIDTMTHHHEGAVMMAEMALKKSPNEELKKFAQKIIDDQKKEIGLMKDWRDKWYAGKPAAKNMEMPGMMDSMKQPMTGDHMKMMEAMTGKDFDLHFLDMMIPHKDAVNMSKNALEKAEHAEIKTLANQIIKAQNEEIEKMTDWKAQWSK
jgi:uncharacterized protein (DUF305 family)